jgi:hypothetical protein
MHNIKYLFSIKIIKQFSMTKKFQEGTLLKNTIFSKCRGYGSLHLSLVKARGSN